LRQITIAVAQMPCTLDRDQNIAQACNLVETAARRGAQVVVLQELFETPYFCIDTNAEFRKQATTLEENPAVAALRPLARKHEMVIPVCFYEDFEGRLFNSLAIIDADGAVLGCYRKSHIPDFPAYEEAYYFAPGDTGFVVWDTKYLRLGAAICWDQWFPEAARIMALKGAELLLYPTAIGRPHGPSNYPVANSKPHWQRTMQGHAAANMVIVAAANRIGIENGGAHATAFYGSSFIADETGAVALELSEEETSVGVATFDLDRIAEFRKYWGVFRTRRPDLYGPVCVEPPPEYLRSR
jgi:N-carbamoylputrescine amidase